MGGGKAPLSNNLEIYGFSLPLKIVGLVRPLSKIQTLKNISKDINIFSRKM